MNLNLYCGVWMTHTGYYFFLKFYYKKYILQTSSLNFNHWDEMINNVDSTSSVEYNPIRVCSSIY